MKLKCAKGTRLYNTLNTLYIYGKSPVLEWYENHRSHGFHGHVKLSEILAGHEPIPRSIIRMGK